jgi:hypothetical protein
MWGQFKWRNPSRPFRQLKEGGFQFLVSLVSLGDLHSGIPVKNQYSQINKRNSKKCIYIHNIKWINIQECTKFGLAIFPSQPFSTENVQSPISSLYTIQTNTGPNWWVYITETNRKAKKIFDSPLSQTSKPFITTLLPPHQGQGVLRNQFSRPL